MTPSTVTRGPIERFDEGLGQRETRSLDDNMIGRALAIEQLCHGGKEIVRDRTANAPIGELDNVVFATAFGAAFLQNLAVHADIAKLVDDERQTASAAVFQ
jgi:hypothetical protein